VPSNAGLAVHPTLTYVEVARDDRRYIVAEARVEAIFGEGADVVATFKGAALIGSRYRRALEVVPMPDDPQNGWTVVGEDFVSAQDGTGIVHMAPAYGADDYAAGQKHGLPMLNPIDDQGCFEDYVDLVAGQFVKDADPTLVDALRDRGLLFDIGRITHSYPHCWRCDSPLLYVARDSWFIRTTSLKEELLANNEQVAWYPPEIGENRFGEWLRGNIDWALSRDRYWGTPLPAWVCDRDESHTHWIGSLSELAEAAGELADDFDPHRPFIDELTWACADCDGTMHRTPEVIDVWFDSGAMPFAQWHYPFENQDEFDRHFPADFISEGLDQTRGWFYSLMAISTLLGRGPCYRNVIVNDMILDSEGQKMSKSKGNLVVPWDAIAEHGADAIRWYFITSSNPWVPKRYDAEGVKEAARKFFDTLLSTYHFFRMYAQVEEWSPSDADPAATDRPLLDRWLLSRLDSVVRGVRRELDGYQITKAYRLLGDFVVEDLSNWYVRRSRSRFWGNSDAEDMRAAFRTLWDALRQVSLLAAPVVPFMADWLHRALTGSSAHLERYPQPSDLLDEELEADMVAARTLVSLGRAAREEVKIRVRQPLRRAEAVLPRSRTLSGQVLELVREELNVKQVDFLSDAEELVTLVPRPNYRALGPRFGKKTNEAANVLRALSQEALNAYRDGQPVEFEVDGEHYTLEPGDLEIVQEARGELIVKGEGATTIALDGTLDDELIAEGVARELVNRIQRLRRDVGLEITDRIDLMIAGPELVRDAATTHREFIGGETLAPTMAVEEHVTEGTFEHVREVDLDGTPATIALQSVSA
jgi:isoleucyl-tRNA synthetase